MVQELVTAVLKVTSALVTQIGSCLWRGVFSSESSKHTDLTVLSFGGVLRCFIAQSRFRILQFPYITMVYLLPRSIHLWPTAGLVYGANKPYPILSPQRWVLYWSRPGLTRPSLNAIQLYCRSTRLSYCTGGYEERNKQMLLVL